MVFYCGVIKSNFYFIDSVVPVKSLPKVYTIFPCSLFQSPKNSSIKLTVPQAWIMQIAQPNYLMAPIFPASSLITFQSCIFLFILWSPIDICLGILIHLSFPGVCFFLLLPERAASCLSIFLVMSEVQQNFSRLQQQMEIWGSQRYIPTQTSPPPCSVALRLFQGGLSMEVYHHRHWNILQISHKVFGACSGFPHQFGNQFNISVSPEILNYKAISWVRCRMWQIILLTESRNDPYNI